MVTGFFSSPHPANQLQPFFVENLYLLSVDADYAVVVEFPQGIDDIFRGAACELGDFLACQRQVENGTFVDVFGKENQNIGNPSLYLVV